MCRISVKESNRFKKAFFMELQKRTFDNFDEKKYDAIPADTKNMIWSCYWYPLKKIKAGIPVIAFPTEIFETEEFYSISRTDSKKKNEEPSLGEKLMKMLQDIFIRHHADRVVAVPELCDVYEIEDFTSKIQEKDEDGMYELLYGSEQFLFGESKDFMIYTSHEHTITFAGEWLVDEIKNCMKEWEKYEIKML